MNFVSVLGPSNNSLLMYGSKLTWFCVRAGNYLVLMYGLKLTWFLCASGR